MSDYTTAEIYEMIDEMEEHIAYAEHILRDGFFVANVEEGELHYSIAIEICKKLISFNPNKYRPLLAKYYANAAKVYIMHQRDCVEPPYNKAEPLYLNAISLFEELNKQKPNDYDLELARACKQLGTVYVKLKDRNQAKHYLKSALKIYKKMVSYDKQYELDISNIYENLARNTSWVNLPLKCIYYIKFIFFLFIKS